MLKKLLLGISWVIGIVGVTVWNGFVAKLLWAWFIVPLGVPALTLLSAVGLCMTLVFLTGIITINTTLSDVYTLLLKQDIYSTINSLNLPPELKEKTTIGVLKGVTKTVLIKTIGKVILTPGFVVLFGLILTALM